MKNIFDGPAEHMHINPLEHGCPIQCFISTCITPENQLLKIKYAFNLETLIIYVGTQFHNVTENLN